MWDTGRGRIAGQQADHTDPSPYLEIVSRRDHPRNRGFCDRPARGHRIEAIVSLTETTRDTQPARHEAD